MTLYRIANLPEKPLTDPRGRPILDQSRKPLAESMVTYLLTLSAGLRFITGLDFVRSCNVQREFILCVRAQEKDTHITLTEEFYGRIAAVMNDPSLRFESATLHCYAELNGAIIGAEKVEAPQAAAAE